VDVTKAPGKRRIRGPALIAGGLLVVAAVSTVGALGLGGGSGEDSKGPGRSGQVVAVSRETLTDRTEVDGQLGHGLEVPFLVKAQGTITWLPASGDTVRRGRTVLRVDDRPVALLYGTLPMYRGLGVRAASEEPKESEESDDTGADAGKAAAGRRQPSAPPPLPLHGMDVKQFETNLSALGYSGFTVDESYTELTALAVKRWQQDLGRPQTGRVGVGDVLYAPGAVRIAGTGAQVGAAAAGSSMSYTGTDRVAVVNAQAGEVDWARQGGPVTVGLPGGRSVRGTVASVGKDATASGSGTDGGATDGGGDGGSDGGSGSGGGGGSDAKAATLAVVITFADQASLGRLQSGPVTVRYVAEQRRNVLAVPVAALVALAEGGYGVEAASAANGAGSGPSGRFVPVRTGLFADGKVEVSGARVHQGMKVMIPR
jgi:hypothetical protein